MKLYRMSDPRAPPTPTVRLYGRFQTTSSEDSVLEADVYLSVLTFSVKSERHVQKVDVRRPFAP